MSYDADDFEQKLKEVRYAATAIQARLSELATIAAVVLQRVPSNEAKPYTCAECGLQFKAEAVQVDHLRNVHGADLAAPL